MDEKIVQKECDVHGDKEFSPIFSPLSSVANLTKQFIRVHKVFWQFLWKLQNHIFRTHGVVENTNFWKKGNLSSEQKVLAHFSCIIEHDNCQGTNCKGSPGILTNFVQMVRSFRWDLKVPKKQTFQKRAVFTVTNVFGPFFLIFSSVKHLREHYLRVHKVIRQLLWKS